MGNSGSSEGKESKDLPADTTEFFSKNGSTDEDMKKRIGDKNINGIMENGRSSVEIKRLSADKTEFCYKTGSTVEDMKKHLAVKFGRDVGDIDIVCLDGGRIHKDPTPLDEIPRPLQVMIGNPDRKAFTTTFINNSPDKDLITMSCGHSITPEDLFNHMKFTLIYKGEPDVRCDQKNCNAIWGIHDIFRYADMTEDEKIFFGESISLNLLYKTGSEISECPSCGNFCTRQEQELIPTRCLSCSNKNGTPFDFCWICKSQWVGNHECSITEIQESQNILNDGYENKATLTGYSSIEGVPSIRHCPECFFYIEHLEMCKTMTCQNCNTVFCFSCLQGINNKGKLLCGEYNENCEVAPVQKLFLN